LSPRQALDKCTILDPACGSGAFPMGILQKMVHILFKVDPKNTEWKQRQIARVEAAISQLEELDDAQYREQGIQDLNAQIKDIEEAFANNELDYGRKLYLIENCIYGVDIQSIATQISKLRFFISLVVDQRVDPSKDNFGIRPLPNLETKFVAANTLIGIEKPKAQLSLFDTPEIKKLEADLKKVRHRLFSSKSPSHKRKLREQDKALREQIAAVLQKNGWTTDTANKLANWDPYNLNDSAGFFDPEWMFDISDGFDIVIGNPPYIKEYTDKSAFDGIRGSKYYQGKMDLWYAFGCVGIDHLKTNGFLCFIATNNWVTNSGASILRDKVLDETKIEQLLDFGSYMIFESAAIQTMILIVQKSNFDKYIIDYRKIEGSNATLKEVNDLLLKHENISNSIRQFKLEKETWKGKTLNFENDEIDSVLQAISSKANFKLDEKKEVAQGIVPNPDVVNSRNIQKLSSTSVTVGEGVFIVEKGNFDHLDLVERKYVKPVHEPYLVDRYKLGENDKEIIYISKANYENDAPSLVKHLAKYRSIMEDRRENQNGRLEFFHLHWPRDEYFFEVGPKILSVRKCSKPTFVYTIEESYVMMSFNVIKSNRINLKYLTAILNSKLIEFWLRCKGKMQGDLFQVDKAPILEIPIYKAPESECKVIEILVDYVLYLTALIEKSSADKVILQHFDKIIDAIVFELYFSDHMKEKRIDVLQFIQRDIEEVMQGKVFENLENTAKEKVIEQLYAKWTDPDNEVRNRIKLFAVRSPEILKPILESK
jgi:tRNA1(Val) A37 N6-methylase TrmN6